MNKKKGRLTPKKVLVTKNGKTFEQTVYVTSEVEQTKQKLPSRAELMKQTKKMKTKEIIQMAKDNGVEIQESGHEGVDRMRAMGGMLKLPNNTGMKAGWGNAQRNGWGHGVDTEADRKKREMMERQRKWREEEERRKKMMERMFSKDSSETKPKKEEKKVHINDYVPTRKGTTSNFERVNLNEQFTKLSPKGKAVAKITGVVPLDAQAENYLVESIKNGQMAYSDLVKNLNDIVLPKQADYAFFDSRGLFSTSRTSSARIEAENVAEMLKGTELEDSLKEYAKKKDELKSKFQKCSVSTPTEVVKTINAVNTLKKMHESGEFTLDFNKRSSEYRNDLMKFMDKFAKMDDDEFNQTWNELNMHSFFTENIADSFSQKGEQNALVYMLNMAFPSELSGVFNKLAKAYDSSPKSFDKVYEKADKRDLINKLSEAMQKTSDFEFNDDAYFESMQLGGKMQYVKNRMHEIVLKMSENGKIDFGKVVSDMDDLAKLNEYFTSDDVLHLEFNMGLANVIKKGYDEDSKERTNFRILDKDAYMQLRKHGENLAKAHIKSLSSDDEVGAIIDKINAKPDPTTIQGMYNLIKEGKFDELPDIDVVPSGLKTSLRTANKEELADATKELNESSKYDGHAETMGIKVKNVYIVGNQNNEDEYKKIQGEESPLLYRCSGADGLQRFMREQGQFKTYKNPYNNKNTLGDGIYLAESAKHASKFIAGGINRNDYSGISGVIMGCVAKLGRVAETDNRSSIDNQKLLDNGADSIHLSDSYNEFNCGNDNAVMVKYYYDVELT